MILESDGISFPGVSFTETLIKHSHKSPLFRPGSRVFFPRHDTLSLSLYTFFLLILSFCVFFFSSSSSSTSSSPTDRCERNYITSPWNFFFNYPYFFESRISERFSFFNDVYHYRCFFWKERKNESC